MISHAILLLISSLTPLHSDKHWFEAGFMSSALTLCLNLPYNFTEENINDINSTIDFFYKKSEEIQQHKSAYIQGFTEFFDTLKRPESALYKTPEDSLMVSLSIEKCDEYKREAKKLKSIIEDSY